MYILVESTVKKHQKYTDPESGITTKFEINFVKFLKKNKKSEKLIDKSDYNYIYL